jgi:CMP/dCMP kinase
MKSESTGSAPLVIVLDGPAGSGKSTVARRVAQALGITLLDTGAIYRTLALAARRSRVSWQDGDALAELACRLRLEFRLEGERNRVLLDGEEVTDSIRTPEMSQGASQVSALPQVRQALLGLQRSFAARGSLVAEGRDLGTVVFPEAALKVFLSADPEQRARRRMLELAQAGRAVPLDEVRREQDLRDAADSGRAVAPLRAAADAHTVDTSRLTVEEVVQTVLELLQRRNSCGPASR